MPIYLDHHATTPCDPRVFAAMKPYFVEIFGNSASRNHAFGWAAEEAVANARQEVAALLGAKAKEIIFTSGATEANNLAIIGFARAGRDRGRHIVTSAIEHKSILDPCDALEREGFRITYVAPDRDGIVSVADVEAAICDDTILVSLMLANNEVGTLQPVDDVGRMCRSRGIAMHCDAVQGVGHCPLALDAVDMVSLSAHKIYGPKGVGALYVRRRPKVRLDAIIYGGGHERGLRSGTLNVPGVVGFGAAAKILREENIDLAPLRDRLRAGLAAIDGYFENGHPHKRLGHNLACGFEGVDAESLLLAVQNRIALSSGSACTSHALAPSHVLRAMGIRHDRAAQSIRFGLGRSNTTADIDIAIDAMTEAVRHLRG